MKSIHQRMLENLIWLRENMIAKGKDVTKITEDIDRLRAEIAAGVA
ncbi:MAG: hypothetical protein NUV74_05140 [Candidatus Brocadiaceae bacterium]|nr:hypothetical protein [Candidatus Brocadiaceae bacterium]